MPTYVALLRSVNVAGHGRMAMADLQQSFRNLGYQDVTTFIQTGNVIFNTAKAVSRQAERPKSKSNWPRTSAAVRPSSFARRPSCSPCWPPARFPAQGADPSRHHVTFMATDPDPDRAGRASCLRPAARMR